MAPAAEPQRARGWQDKGDLVFVPSIPPELLEPLPKPRTLKDILAGTKDPAEAKKLLQKEVAAPRAAPTPWGRTPRAEPSGSGGRA